IDGDGLLDYSAAVFVKNVLLSGQDLLTGNGVIDYFSDVLGVDATAGDVPLPEPTELPAGKVPANAPALADERAAIET
ncbi:hypothetical protein ACXWOE_10075, partial [Streptococcus pyogenes]